MGEGAGGALGKSCFSSLQLWWYFLQLVKGEDMLDSRQRSERRGKRYQWDPLRQAREMQVNNGVTQSPDHPEERASLQCFSLTDLFSSFRTQAGTHPSSARMGSHQVKNTAPWPCSQIQPKCSTCYPEQAVCNPSARKGLGVCWVTADRCFIAHVSFNKRKLPDCSLAVSDKLQPIPYPTHPASPRGHAPALAGKPVKPSEGCFKPWPSN